jgi:hypothetical protein
MKDEEEATSSPIDNTGVPLDDSAAATEDADGQVDHRSVDVPGAEQEIALDGGQQPDGEEQVLPAADVPGENADQPEEGIMTGEHPMEGEEGYDEGAEHIELADGQMEEPPPTEEQTLEDVLERVLNERDELAEELAEERKTLAEAADLVQALEQDLHATQARLAELEQAKAAAPRDAAPCENCKKRAEEVQTKEATQGSALNKAALALVSAVIVQLLLLMIGW